MSTVEHTVEYLIQRAPSRLEGVCCHIPPLPDREPFHAGDEVSVIGRMGLERSTQSW